MGRATDTACMTLPRQIVPGRTYLVTRRCRDRRFLLRPDATVNRIFRYCIARAAERCGASIHAVVVLSNHFHIVLTDEKGNLPVFCHWLDRFSASAINAWRSRRGNVFEASEKVSVVWLASEEAVIDKLAYLFGNPVCAGLVDNYRQWPGFCTRIEHLAGHSAISQRPDVYFRPAHHRATCRLTLGAPPMFRGREAWLIRAVKQRVREMSIQVLRQLRRANRRVLGTEAVLATSWSDAPATDSEGAVVRPTFAAVTKSVLLACVHARREFCAAYQRALAAFRRGVRDVVFPCGTWWMTYFGGAKQNASIA